MRIVRHPNIVELKAFYYSNGDRVGLRPFDPPTKSLMQPGQKDEVYLNLVLEFVPETVYRASRYFNKMKTTMPIPRKPWLLLAALLAVACTGWSGI
ncbi:MAG: hypothetical protein EOP84_21145 [Verrucomicrobiaceae bacterium]|nr:MAG: hypothetical protein EOP84_21145 [Verrucomicrobiaceae bacterium]